MKTPEELLKELVESMENFWKVQNTPVLEGDETPEGKRFSEAYWAAKELVNPSKV